MADYRIRDKCTVCQLPGIAPLACVIFSRALNRVGRGNSHLPSYCFLYALDEQRGSRSGRIQDLNMEFEGLASTIWLAQGPVTF